MAYPPNLEPSNADQVLRPRRALASGRRSRCGPGLIRGSHSKVDSQLARLGERISRRGGLANTIKLIAQCPKVIFILDHIGKPDIKHHLLDPWQQEIKTLAGLPNVWCKVSGLVTEADHEHWTEDDLKPYIDSVIDSFGFDRVMYGGDWPVAYQATEYPRWVETLEWAVGGCSEGELRKLFHDNAIGFYKLA